MCLGEPLAECAVRETRECAYDDGEVRQEFSICFLARPVAGEAGALVVSDESTDVRWFAPEEVDALPMVAGVRKRVDDWRQRRMPAIR